MCIRDSANTVDINNGKESKKVTAKNIIIATGSKPTKLPFIDFDGDRIISSTEALKLKEIPKHLIVVGGGVIGLELGQVYKRLGSAVTVIEFQDRIIPNMDGSLSKELAKVFKKSGVKIMTNHKVKSISRKDNIVTVAAENSKGEDQLFQGDYCLIAIGRTAYTEGLKLSNIAVETDERGRINVNENLQTSIPHIYAIGDVIKGSMLAHKAEEEGVFVAEHICGQKPHIDYNFCLLYTSPSPRDRQKSRMPSSA